MRHGLLLCCWAMSCSAAWADTFRCGTDLVSEESTLSEVIAKCGEPASKSVSETEPVVRMPDGFMRKLPPVRTEVWTYDRGRNSFPMKVTIVDGKITKMEIVR